MGGKKKVVIFFGGLEVFYYFYQIIPNCGVGRMRDFNDCL